MKEIKEAWNNIEEEKIDNWFNPMSWRIYECIQN